MQAAEHAAKDRASVAAVAQNRHRHVPLCVCSVHGTRGLAGALEEPQLIQAAEQAEGDRANAGCASVHDAAAYAYASDLLSICVAPCAGWIALRAWRQH